MKSNRGWLLLALPLSLAACGGDEGDTAETPADSAIAAIDAPTVDTAPMGAMPTTLALQSVDSSGVMGQATVIPNGDMQTQVQVQLSGLTPGAHPGHIHEGKCPTPGAVVHPLPEITASADGSGSAATTLPVDASTFMDGNHVITYHGEGGKPVACGDLVAHAM